MRAEDIPVECDKKGVDALGKVPGNYAVMIKYTGKDIWAPIGGARDLVKAINDKTIKTEGLEVSAFFPIDYRIKEVVA